MNDEFYFWHIDKYQSLLQFNTIILVGMTRHSQSTQNRFAYLRLGKEEKGRRMVTTRLLLSKVSG